MARGISSSLVRYVRRIAFVGQEADPDDKGLVERFVSQHDEAAFEALLRRHGPMVLGVCQRLLTNPSDAEDAFQATFLVFLRKASSLSRRELVANWLYGVAYRTALKARGREAQRREHYKNFAVHSQMKTSEQTIWQDLRPVLDEEVRRLPAKYRSPVVLCYFQGKTLTEAAEQLGWPAGTVSGRLSRARDLLRKRLTRRGLAISGGLLTMHLSESMSSALSPALISVTLRSAALVIAAPAAATGTLSPSVATLMKGVLQAMLLSKIKVASSILFVLVLVSTGVGVLAMSKSAAHQTEERVPETAKPPPKIDNKLPELYKALLEAARTEMDARRKEFEAGRGTLDIMLGASRRLLQAEVESSQKRPDQIAAYEAHLKRMKEAEELNQARFNAGRIMVQDLAQSTYYRVEAEIWLERAKRGMKIDRWSFREDLNK
jgi:RNA polymerase sigma factor (sigma-70 family)